MAAAYPPSIQNIIDRGHVPKIKATRAALNLDYDVANNILQRIMDLVYKRALQVVIDAPVNYDNTLTIEQIEQIHKYMYDYVGIARSIPLGVLIGLRDPSEPSKVVMQKRLITELFGSMEQSKRKEVFEGGANIEHPEGLQIRFGHFYPGSELHAIFIENARIVPNAPLDAVQYHMTIGPLIELNGLAQGYHMTNYFYSDPHGAQRTFYRNNGAILENKPASMAEAVRRKEMSDRIKAVLEAASAPLTPKRRRAANIAALLHEPKRALTEVAAAAYQVAAAPAVEQANVFDPKSEVIYSSTYILDTKPKVRLVNGTPTLTVRLMEKSGKVVAILTLGNLVHYGIGSYSAEVLNEDSIPFRSFKGRKYMINFDDTDIPIANRDLLADAEEVRCSSSAPSPSAASGGGGGGSVCTTPKGEPLAVYLMREKFSNTPLGDALYVLLIAYFSTMPTSPKKLNLGRALWQLIDVITDPRYADELATSPEAKQIRDVLDKYGLYHQFSTLNRMVLDIYNAPDPTKSERNRYQEFKQLSTRFPPIPIEDLDEVEKSTYVTDPAIYFDPPLNKLVLELQEFNRTIDFSKMSPTKLQNLLDKVLDKIRDAARVTPESHPSFKEFKKQIMDTTPFGAIYLSKYGPLKGKQGGGKRRFTHSLKRLRRRTRKAN